MRLRYLTIAILIFGASSVFAAKKKPAEPYPGKNTLEIKVDGLTCPFCGYGLEKRLKKVKFVKKVTIFIDEGRVIVLLSPKAPIDLKAARKAVRDGGFTPRRAILGAKGTVERKEKRWIFLVEGSETVLMLNKNGKLDQLLKDKLGGKSVLIKGVLSTGDPTKGHGEHPANLAIEDYSIPAENRP